LVEINTTKREKLDVLIEQAKQNAENQLDFAGKVSIFMNKQDVFNSEIRGFIESNPKTNQKGLVEQVKENTDEISLINTEKKVDKAKIGVIGIIIGAVLTFISKIFF
jgi:hypothetical protein